MTHRKNLASLAFMFGSTLVFVGGAFGQGGGFQQIQPVLVSEPLFAPSQQFPHGQHWIVTTKTHYAWALVGYNPLNPPTVDLSDPNRVIAFIDTGIDLHHVEFGGPPGDSGSIIHDHSTSILETGASSPVSQLYCDCDATVFQLDLPEDFMPNLPNVAAHGSLVSGIGSALVNQIGMAGMCWDCGLLVIRVAAVAAHESCPLPGGVFCRHTGSTISDAIKYAAGWDFDTQSWLPQPRSRIISMSNEVPSTIFTGLSCEPDFEDRHPIAQAIEQAYDRGCIIVAIAGNQYANCWSSEDDEERCIPGSTSTPGEIQSGIAMHPKTIAVGGACLTGEYWHCRSRINPLLSGAHISPCCPSDPPSGGLCEYPSPWPLGADPYRLPVLSVVAPMTRIFGTWGDGVIGTSNDDFGYAEDGTSFVAPQIAGIIALMLRVNPDLTFEQVKHILEVTATDIEDPGYDAKTGHGLVNARAAVEYVIKMALPANFNGDESIDTLDAIDYLIAYGQGDVTADLDLDGEHTEADLAIFMNSYLEQ